MGVEGNVIMFNVAVPVPPTVSVIMRLVPVEVELLSNSEGPLGTMGEIVAVTFTFPAKPTMLVRVILEVPDEPAWIVNEVGLAAIVKSGIAIVTVTVTLATRDNGVPPTDVVPVTVTV